MREIIFRGKRLNNGEWVEGSLCTTIPSDENFYTISYFDFEGYYIEEKVIPETVGQYTGLTDKNGKKIFEGDILAGDDYPFTSDSERNYFAEVVWFDNCPAFGTVTHRNPKSNVRGISDGNTDFIEDFESIKWEVISNIHDNPELLKGDKDNGRD